jgi:hypothetical protein
MLMLFRSLFCLLNGGKEDGGNILIQVISLHLHFFNLKENFTSVEMNNLL